MKLIALGGNLASPAGMPAETLRTALNRLTTRGVTVRAVSPFYVTPAWPDPSDPPFVNAVARIETALAPNEVMKLLHALEEEFGRVRSARNAPRTLDLDLLDYDGRVTDGPPVLPHPRIAERAFVLVPLSDIAPDWRHPVTGQSISTLLDALPAQARALPRLDRQA